MRIRSIKPEFWRSQDISAIQDWDHRFIFIGLWSYVDDNGVGLDRLSLIATDLFADDVERDPQETFARVSRGLQKLSEHGRIVRYTVDGKDYLHITNWGKHQRIDKPNKARYPLPTSENAEVRETLAESSRDPRESPAPGTGEQGNRGTGEQETSSPPSPATVYDFSARSSFDDFWNIYPRKVGKEAAKKAFTKAVKQAGAETVLEGARRFAADPNLPDDKTFIPHASTWLNRGSWEDEPMPARSQGMWAGTTTRPDALRDSKSGLLVER